MCGRFGLDIRPSQLSEHFGIPDSPVLAPRYNIAPSQNAACVMVHPESGLRVIRKLRFGLVPHWAGDVKIGNKLINARAETVQSKPAFAEAFAKRRLIVPVSGFYEWNRTGDRQPWYFVLKNGVPMGFAGIWDRRRDKTGGETLFSFAIITVPANDLVGRVHERMPAVLTPKDYAEWLGAVDPEQAAALLRPYLPGEMKAWPVSRRVNSPNNDDPSLIEPLAV